MSIYDINFKKAANRLLPPDKRFKKQVSWLTALFSPLQWLRDLWFGSYVFSATANLYSVGATYNKYDQVRYGVAIYESLTGNNAGHYPTDPNYWRLIQDDFLGIKERIKYTGQDLVLTFAANHFLSTTFRQPPLRSDTYFTAGVQVLAGFRTAATTGSTVGATFSSDNIGGSTLLSTPVHFTIHVPIAAYNATTEDTIRNFINKYIPLSISFNIVAY